MQNILFFYLLKKIETQFFKRNTGNASQLYIFQNKISSLFGYVMQKDPTHCQSFLFGANLFIACRTGVIFCVFQARVKSRDTRASRYSSRSPEKRKKKPVLQVNPFTMNVLANIVQDLVPRALTTQGSHTTRNKYWDFAFTHFPALRARCKFFPRLVRVVFFVFEFDWLNFSA